MGLPLRSNPSDPAVELEDTVLVRDKVSLSVGFGLLAIEDD